MYFAFGAVSGVTLPPTATRPRDPSVPSVQRNTPRETTAARSRAARWEKAACAHTLRQSARTAEALVERGRMPAGPRGSPSTQQGGGGRHPHHGGRRGGKLPVRRPRVSRRADRRSILSPRLGWRVWRSRSPAFRLKLFIIFPFVFLFFLFFCHRWNGGKEILGIPSL